ncbi:LysM peptidoglycan-binding domain-containing protein [Nocardioides gilvus]|uniref:LysM peptidoglycan-binding domain-containing protein n=1 Tax=Nocardioides gilvus TaxID=1735589 RepID=UPI0013A5A67D|nr:LysM domain-containing protein [Nocardioides gilvus]
MNRHQSGTFHGVGVASTTQGTAAVSALRCVAVWAGVTVVAAAGAALGVTAVLDGPFLEPTSIDQALVTGSGIGAAVLCPWLWLIATLAVFDALRGRVSSRAGWTRRLTLLACGVAVTTSVVASPSHAALGHQEPGDSTERTSLSGLPYPDRASGGKQHGVDGKPAPPPVQASTPPSAEPVERPRATATTGTAATTGTTAGTAITGSTPARTPPGTHRVRAGDTLWAIAEATTAGNDIPSAVTELHRLNRRVIGNDPDLIRPGQILDLHSEGDEPR